MSDKTPSKPALSRRGFLSGAATGALALVGGVITVRDVKAAPQDAAKRLGELTGGAALTEDSDKVTLELPEVADNGSTVPVTIVVNSPMTDADYVKTIHVLAEGNPTPNVISFNLTPACGRGQASFRMRLASTQKVVAAAVMSDGSVHVAKKEIKVTIGGCGG